MKVRVTNSACLEFGISGMFKQTTNFGCFGTSVAMIFGFDLEESEIPLTMTDVEFTDLYATIANAELAGLDRESDNNDLVMWLEGNGITYEVHKDKPKNKPSVSVNIRPGNGHAMVVVGDMGYIDPWTGLYSKDYPLNEAENPYTAVGYFTFSIED